MSASEAEQPLERRSKPRQRMNAIVKLDAGTGSEPIACFVWDMSEDGARLKLSVSTDLEEVVNVLIGNVRKPATVRWRKGDQIGLEFFPD
jgi:hypothetical protein